MPDSLLVAPWGPLWPFAANQTDSPIVNDATLALLPRYEEKFELTRIPIFAPGSRDGLGLGVPRVIAGRGINLEDIQWLPNAAAELLKRQFLAPTVWVQTGKLTQTVLMISCVTLADSAHDYEVKKIGTFLALSASHAQADGKGKPLMGFARTRTAFETQNAVDGV